MKYEKQKPWDIRERSFEYALRAIKLYQFLQQNKNQAGHIIGKQFFRSATSIGANIEEAQSGTSKADFIHKYTIAQKEARESLYWLRLLAKSEIIPSQNLISLFIFSSSFLLPISYFILHTSSFKSCFLPDEFFYC